MACGATKPAAGAVFFVLLARSSLPPHPQNQTQNPSKKSPKKSVYRGEWMQGEMHGCGIKLWRDDDGEPTATPRQQSPTTPPSAPPANAVTVRAAEGRFARDLFAGPGLSPCDDPQSALDAAVEADYAAAQARSFAERRRQQMGAVSAGKSRGGGAAPTVVRGGRPPLGRAEEEQKKSKGQSGGGWFGGLFGGHKDDAPLPANTRVRANDDGGPGALASLGQGDRALLTALVDRVVAHEVALAMAAEVDAAPAAAAAGVAAAAGGGGGGRPS
jgi:hypothetical protein